MKNIALFLCTFLALALCATELSAQVPTIRHSKSELKPSVGYINQPFEPKFQPASKFRLPDLNCSAPFAKTRLNAKLDSIYMNVIYAHVTVKLKYLYEFEGNNKMTIYTYKAGGGKADWTRLYKLEATYDQLGRLAEATNYKWSVISDSWKEAEKTQNTYTGYNGVNQITTKWDPDNNTIEEMQKLEISRTMNNKPLNYEGYFGNFTDPGNVTWILMTKGDYEYNLAGKITKEEHYEKEFFGDTWSIGRKSEYSYGTNGHIVQKTDYNLDGEWLEASKTEHTWFHDSLDEVRSFRFENNVWWMNLDKRKKYFDLSGNLVRTEQFYYDDTFINPWQKNEKIEYDLNYRYNWPEIAQPFQPTELEISNLDENHEDIRYMPEVVRYYSAEDNEWKLDESDRFYLSAISVYLKTPDVSDMNIKLFPNPVTDFLNISSAQKGLIELFAVDGKKLLSGNFDGRMSIPVTHLTAGLYIVCLTVDNQKYYSRILKTSQPR